MLFSLRRISAGFAVFLLLVISTSCGDRAGPTSLLSPSHGPSFDGYPEGCNSQATCIGKSISGPLSGVQALEKLQVCKYYPSTVVNPPAAIITIDVKVGNPTPSPTHLVYVLPANSCMLYWQNGEAGSADTVTVTESVPGGYTASAQTTNFSSTGPVGVSPRTVGTSVGPVVATNTVTVLIGGAHLPSALVAFTNTPVPIPEMLGSIGDFVWNDTNGNGVQDSGEPGIPGVTVNLSGPTNSSTVTDGNGAYLFPNLSAGAYTVSVATPSGYVSSPTGAGTPATDSNNGAGTSVSIAGNNDTSIDFGFYRLGAIGNFVWNDVNANGVQDGSEPGIPGVVVTLTNGSSTTTATTDGAGAYSFSGLVPGSYTVSITAPSGYVASPQNAGTPSTDSNNGAGTTVAIAGNTDDTIDFGFYQLDRKSVV